MPLDPLAAERAQWRFEVDATPHDAAAFHQDGRWVDLEGGRAWVIRAQSGEDTIDVGAIFEGGRSTFVLPTAGDARRLANSFVLLAGRTIADARPIAERKPAEADGGLAIVLDPNVAKAITALPPLAAAEVPALARKRLDLLDEIEAAADHAATEAAIVAAGDRGGGYGMVDLRFSDRLHLLSAQPVSVDPEPDRWLSWRTAPTIPSGCGTLRAVGRNADRDPFEPTVAHLPCEAGSAPTDHFALVSTTLDLQAAPTADAISLQVELSETLALRVVGRPVRFLTLRFVDDVDDLSVTTVSVDGRTARHIRSGSSLLVDLGTAVQGTFRLDIRGQDRWRWGNVMSNGSGGRSTGLQFPWLVGPGIAGPEAGPTEITVRVPLRGKIDVLLPGEETLSETADMRVVRAEVPAGSGYVGLMLGEFEDAVEQGAPPIAAHLLQSGAASIPPITRTMIAYYEQLLPARPKSQVDVGQAPDDQGRLVWMSPYALVSLQQARGVTAAGATSGEVPHWEELTLAHEVAHQWWGNRVQRASSRESWVHETLAETYASLFGRAAWGDDWRGQLEAEHRRLCEAAPEGVSIALTNPVAHEASLYECGPYVIGGLWFDRLGIDAVLGAFDAIQQKHPGGTVTTEEIRSTLSAMAKRDVGPLVDWILEDGFLPNLSGSWSEAGGVVEGEVRADVPFATFEVPVLVTDGKVATKVWVTVKDGVGHFSAPGTKAHLDPEKLVPARGRRFERR